MRNLGFIIPIFSLFLFAGCQFFDNQDDVFGPAQGFLPPPVENFLEENYPNFTVSDIERDDICGDNSVRKIVLEDDQGMETVIYYDMNWTFLFTAEYIDDTDLPTPVLDSIEFIYPSYTLELDEIQSYTFEDSSVQYKVILTADMTPDVEAVFEQDGTIACAEEEGQDDDDDGNDDDDDGEDDDDDGDDDDDDDGEDDDDDDDGDDDDDIQIPGSVIGFINSNFGGYGELEAELDDLCGDVDVYLVKLKNEPGPDAERYLYFDLNWVFLFVAQEVPASELTDQVLDTLEVEYPGYTLDEVERLDMADDSIQFKVELETANDDDDVEATIDAEGNIICVR